MLLDGLGNGGNMGRRSAAAAADDVAMDKVVSLTFPKR